MFPRPCPKSWYIQNECLPPCSDLPPYFGSHSYQSSFHQNGNALAPEQILHPVLPLKTYNFQAKMVLQDMLPFIFKQKISYTININLPNSLFVQYIVIGILRE